MKIYTLHREQFMPITVEEAWDFFSHPLNLDKITPPRVRFETITKLPDNYITNGQRIKYKLRPLLNIPMRWETEIREVNMPYKFMDKQMKGPYAFWEHTHILESVPGGTKMTDTVRYALPMGLLGRLMHSLMIKQQLDQIFDFRAATLVQLFGEYEQQS